MNLSLCSLCLRGVASENLRASKEVGEFTAETQSAQSWDFYLKLLFSACSARGKFFPTGI